MITVANPKPTVAVIEDYGTLMQTEAHPYMGSVDNYLQQGIAAINPNRLMTITQDWFDACIREATAFEMPENVAEVFRLMADANCHINGNLVLPYQHAARLPETAAFGISVARLRIHDISRKTTDIVSQAMSLDEGEALEVIYRTTGALRQAISKVVYAAVNQHRAWASEEGVETACYRMLEFTPAPEVRDGLHDAAVAAFTARKSVTTDCKSSFIPGPDPMTMAGELAMVVKTKESDLRRHLLVKQTRDLLVSCYRQYRKGVAANYMMAPPGAMLLEGVYPTGMFSV